MRRFLPWALLGLLVLGIGAGAVLGQVQAPGATTSDWPANVLATTASAGSAHFRFTDVTSSPDPSEDSTVAGSGVVDFRNDRYRVTVLYRQHQYESTNGGPPRLTEEVWGQKSVAIGQTVYSEQTVFNVQIPQRAQGGWAVAHFPRADRQAFGLEDATGAEEALAGLEGYTAIAAVRDLGPDSVDGVAATRFVVTNEPLYVCGARGQTILVHRFAPTTVWVDGQGRLLRAQTSVSTPRFTTHGLPSGSGGSPPVSVAASTTDATLTFSDFGSSVHIAAPTAHPRGSAAIISLKAQGSTSPCRG